jgi:hypothetical protein
MVPVVVVSILLISIPPVVVSISIPVPPVIMFKRGIFWLMRAKIRPQWSTLIGVSLQAEAPSSPAMSRGMLKQSANSFRQASLCSKAPTLEPAVLVRADFRLKLWVMVNERLHENCGGHFVRSLHRRGSFPERTRGRGFSIADLSWSAKLQCPAWKASRAFLTLRRRRSDISEPHAERFCELSVSSVFRKVPDAFLPRSQATSLKSFKVPIYRARDD